MIMLNMPSSGRLPNHNISAAGRIRRAWVKKNSLKWQCGHWGGGLADLPVIWALLLPRTAPSILATEAQCQHTLTLKAVRNPPEETKSLSEMFWAGREKPVPGKNLGLRRLKRKLEQYFIRGSGQRRSIFLW